MLEMLEAGLKPADLDRAFDTVCLYDEVEFPPGDAPMPDPGAGWAELERFWTALQKSCRCRSTRHRRARSRRTANRFAASCAWRRSIAASAACWSRCWKRGTANRRSRRSGGLTTRPRRRGSRRKCRSCTSSSAPTPSTPFLRQWRQYVYRHQRRAACAGARICQAGTPPLNTLNYGDLLQLAAEVLRENAGVRAGARREVSLGVCRRVPGHRSGASGDHVPARGRASAAKQSPEAADWRTVSLRPGALFVVGDPKQSIYRFRRADIEIYNEVRTLIGRCRTVMSCR